MVWEGKRKSELIESMILGYPIPPLYAKKMLNDGVYYIMDGKQRISATLEVRVLVDIDKDINYKFNSFLVSSKFLTILSFLKSCPFIQMG